jgi:hypothetical protein
MRRHLLKGAALLASAATLSGVAGASEALTPAAPAPPPPAVPHEHAATPVTAADSAQLATLGVLRRAAQAGDAVPERVRTHVAEALGPDVGANADLARRALRTASGEDVYVIPGRGWVCLASSAGPAGCTPTDQVAAGYAVSLQRLVSGAVRIGGLVPDGVARVTVRGTAGETASAEVSGNAWRAELGFTPADVSWARAGAAEVSVPVYVPADDLPNGNG